MDLQGILTAMARSSIHLGIQGAAPASGATRFGGVPDVPADFIWPRFETDSYDDDTVLPRPLAFLAQFRCEELHALDREGLLPETGLLSFFYELGSQRWGFDPKDAGCARVFWFAGPVSPTSFPEDLPEEYRLPDTGIHLEEALSYPGGEDVSLAVEHLDWAALEKARATLTGKAPEEEGEGGSKLFGWPDIMQGNMTGECELVRRGHYMGNGRADFPAEDLRAAEAPSLDSWRLLLQLDSSSELMFGDCGRIYFYITREDLAARRFDRTWLILQCG